LLTGSNYNDNEKKVTGGRNGYGAKLANIFSKRFIVEAADGVNKLRFHMEWNGNMSNHTPAEITRHVGKDSTKITFYPDFERFRMVGLDPDTTNLLKKRVYDMAGVLGKKVKVILNGEQLPVRDFSQYVDMYLADQEEPTKIIEKQQSSNWEVIVSLSDTEFKQVSFVNSICTFRGGTHVNMLADQIV
jgi:DNA topoisomerase-2